MNDDASADAGAAGYKKEELIARCNEVLTPLQRQWLKPHGAFGYAAQRCLYSINWLSCRILFRLQIRGHENLPAAGPFVLTPSHTSSLDPLVLAAALPYRLIRNTFWAGRASAVLANPVRRGVNRITQVMPLEGSMRSLAAAAAVLRRGKNLVWFPEGTRSLTGELQPFKLGIGVLLAHFPDVPAIPIYIDGARRAAPPPQHLPRRLTRIRVVFGAPFLPAVQTGRALDEEAYEKIARELQARVAELSKVSS